MKKNSSDKDYFEKSYPVVVNEDKRQRLHHYFENNENFLLCCFTKQQYESCLQWCHGNGYLTDSEYSELTDIDIFDRFIYEDLLEYDIKRVVGDAFILMDSIIKA